MIAVLLALFPVLYLFAPRLAFVSLALAIVLLCHRRLAASRSTARSQVVRSHPATLQDPWDTGGLDR
jgi:hypothetical protein